MNQAPDEPGATSDRPPFSGPDRTTVVRIRDAAFAGFSAHGLLEQRSSPWLPSRESQRSWRFITSVPRRS